jgi:hypothetical protein
MGMIFLPFKGGKPKNKGGRQQRGGGSSGSGKKGGSKRTVNMGKPTTGPVPREVKYRTLILGTARSRWQFATRALGAMRGSFATIDLDQTKWAGSATPALGDFFENRVIKYAQVNNQADRLDSTILASVGDRIALGTYFLFQMKRQAWLRTHARSLMTSATDSASFLPITQTSYKQLVDLAKSIGKLPSVCFTLANFYVSSLQSHISQPGQDVLTQLFLPIGYRSCTVANMQTIYGYLMA